MVSHGYSGTPLYKKLGIKEGMRLDALCAPSFYQELLVGMPESVTVICDDLPSKAVFIHLFVVKRSDLEAQAFQVVSCLVDGGALWVSWPKKTSPLHEDVDEQSLRDVFLPLGVVDVKVCAIDADWSGLKFMWRRK
jgi:hypothetical protein